MRGKYVNLLIILVLALILRPQTAHKTAVVETSGSAQALEQLIIIDADVQRLTLYENGVEVKRYGVAVGTRQTPSPLGVWRITSKRKNWGSGFGTRFMGLNCPWGIYGIHGTNKPGSIGSHASHGCIRMLNSDVEDLYERVNAGTPVIIEHAAYGALAGPTRNINPGDRGADVRQLQIRLRNEGHDVGYVDGVYGEATKRMLLAYKREKGLPLTHTADYQTRLSLGMILFE